MKSFAAWTLFVVSVCRMPAADIPVPHVTVFGTAIVRAKPDQLRWRITLSNEGADLPLLAEKHAQLTTEVLGVLQQKQIAPADMQTSEMRFSEKREYRNNSWFKDGYIATTEVTFLMRNTSGYKEMWLGLARIGGASVDSVSWDVANRIELQKRARTDALATAKTKAAEMAEALGSKVVEAIAIEEELMESVWSGQMVQSNTMAHANDGGAADTEGIAPGEVPIRSRVHVSFRIAQ